MRVTMYAHDSEGTVLLSVKREVSGMLTDVIREATDALMREFDRLPDSTVLRWKIVTISVDRRPPL